MGKDFKLKAVVPSNWSNAANVQERPGQSRPISQGSLTTTNLYKTLSKDGISSLVYTTCQSFK